MTSSFQYVSPEDIALDADARCRFVVVLIVAS